MRVNAKARDVIKAIIALPAAMILVTLVAFSVGAPLDPYQAEARIREYQESLNRGDVHADGLVTEPRGRGDSASNGSGGSVSDGSGSPSRASFLVRVAGFANWYPLVFGVALFCFWALLRPALGPSLLGGAFVLLCAFGFGPNAGVAALAASLGYFALAIGRKAWRRGRYGGTPA